MCIKINIISCVASNNVIGNAGKLPWGNFKADMARFRNLTMGKSVIMGYATWESIGGILQDRHNIIVTSGTEVKTHRVKSQNVMFVEAPTFSDVIRLFDECLFNELFVIGGQGIYELALPYADKVYLTEIMQDFEGDRFFPGLNMDDWWSTSLEIQHEETLGFDYAFTEYTRKSKLSL